MIEVTLPYPEFFGMGKVMMQTGMIALIAFTVLPVIFRSFGRSKMSILAGSITAAIAAALAFFIILITGGVVNSDLRAQQSKMMREELPGIINSQFDDVKKVENSRVDSESGTYFLVEKDDGGRASVTVTNDKPGKKPNTRIYTLALSDIKEEPKTEKAKDDKKKADEKVSSAGNSNPTKAELDAARVSNKPGYKAEMSKKEEAAQKEAEAGEKRIAETKEERATDDSSKEETGGDGKTDSASTGNSNPTKAELDAARASNKTSKP